MASQLSYNDDICSEERTKCYIEVLFFTKTLFVGIVILSSNRKSPYP
jgi:hypothetical protein